MMDGTSLSQPARLRSGGTVLSLLAGPLVVPILRAHLDVPLRLPDLHERIGGAAQATLRGQVGNLRGIGALERRVRGGMPYTVENELTDAGHGILAVAESVEVWLARAPQGPIALGSEPAKDAIKALVGGWSSTVLHALAARPLSLTELDGAIPEVSYPSLERRLSAMRAARQVEALSGQGRGTPHAVTGWARRAVAPLAAACRCERRHLAEASDPPARIDVEAALLLAVPLAALPAQRGSCLLAVDTGGEASADEGGAERGTSGVHVEIEDGGIASCVSRLEPDPRTWALGVPDAWLDAIVHGRLDRLRAGGEDPDLVTTLIHSLHVSFENDRGT